MTERTTARVIGVLFIVASAAAIVGGTLILPAEDAATLAEVTADRASIVSGALIELLMVWAVIGIAVMFYPVLKREHDGLALGYVGARIVEGVLLLAAAGSALAVVAVAGQADTAGALAGQTETDLLLVVRDTTYTVGSLVALGVGALVLYGLLYRSRIVPSWLSLWGLAGAVLILARGLVEVYGTELSGTVQGILAAPIGVNEMVLAVWLIVKGFRAPVVTLPEVEQKKTVVGVG